MDSDVWIGNTMIRKIYQYKGNPFNSEAVNIRVLALLYPEIEAETIDHNGKKLTQIIFKENDADPAGRPVQFGITADYIETTYLFSPQNLEDFSQNIIIMDSSLDALERGVTSAHGYSGTPEYYDKRWITGTQSVPCVRWLERIKSIDSQSMNINNYLVGDVMDCWRNTGMMFAFHTLPKSALTLTEEIKEKLEKVNKIGIEVQNPDDWKRGVGTVSVDVHYVDVRFYVEFLRAISQ